MDRQFTSLFRSAHNVKTMLTLDTTRALLAKKVNMTKFDYFKTYEWAHSESYNPFEHFLIRMILRKGSPKGRFALDIGCGAGLVLKEMSNVYGCCIGVDISRGILQYTRKSCKVKDMANLFLLCADAESLPFRSGTFDVTTMYSVLHHLPNLNGSLREVNRTMNPKSTLILFHEPTEKTLGQVFERTLIRVLGRIRHLLYRTIHREKWQRYRQEGFHRSTKLRESEKLADVHCPKGFSVRQMKLLLEESGFEVVKIRTRIQSFMGTFSLLCWPYKLIAVLDLVMAEMPVLRNYLPLLLCIARKKEFDRASGCI